DTRGHDGTVTIMQPLIAPLYDGKTAHELIAACLDQPTRTSYDIVRDYWRGRHAKGPATGDDAGERSGASDATAAAGDAGCGRCWRRAVHDGIVIGTAALPRTATLNPGWSTAVSEKWSARDREPATGLEIVFRADPTIGDGRFANNGWLQELPKPITKLTW